MVLQFTEGGSRLSFSPTRLINAGYTGRNQEAVRAHVEELKQMGISAPARTPCFFPKAPERIQQGGKICALDRQCSAEVEFVLLAAEDGWYVTVGCDVFDYKVEGLQADKSKYLYPNVLAEEAWRYEDVKDHWDRLILRSWLGKNRAQRYQEGALAEMMRPEDMVQELTPFLEGGFVSGTVLSGGTLSCLIEGMPYTDCFSFELEDPVLGRILSGVLEMETLGWYHEC